MKEAAGPNLEVTRKQMMKAAQCTLYKSSI